MADLSQKINKIDQKINGLYKQIEALQLQAKNNLKKSQESKGSAKQMYKQRCLIALKKKKQLQIQVKNYNSHQNALNQAIFTAQTMNSHKQMYEGLKNAVQAQKEAMKQVDLDKIDDLHDEMLDMKMKGDMMNEMLARNYDVEYDEDEFEDDFKQFEREVAVQNKNNIAKGIKQPAYNNKNIDINSYLK